MERIRVGAIGNARHTESGLPDLIAFNHDDASLNGDSFSAKRQQPVAAFPRVKQGGSSSNYVVYRFDRPKVYDL